jgi:hypothetical protein
MTGRVATAHRPPPSAAGMAWPGDGDGDGGGNGAPETAATEPLAFRRAHGKSYRLCGVGRGTGCRRAVTAHAHPSVHPQRLNAQRPARYFQQLPAIVPYCGRSRRPSRPV